MEELVLLEVLIMIHLHANVFLVLVVQFVLEMIVHLIHVKMEDGDVTKILENSHVLVQLNIEEIFVNTITHLLQIPNQ